MTISWFVKCFLSKGMSTIRHFDLLLFRWSLMVFTFDYRELRFMTENWKVNWLVSLPAAVGMWRMYLQVQEELEMIVVISRDESFESYTKMLRFLRKMLLWSEWFFEKRCRFSTLLLRLSRDSSHLQQRTRQNGIIVHFFQSLCHEISIICRRLGRNCLTSSTKVFAQLLTISSFALKTFRFHA